jgi:hypothetical protein
MVDSFKLYSKKCAIFLLTLMFLLPLTLSVKALGEADDTVFAEDFEESSLNPDRWIVAENTDMSGYPAYGGSVKVKDGCLLLSSNGSSFPFIHSAVNPFPVSGDFEIEFAVTYSCIGDAGCGIMIASGIPTLDNTWHNKIVTLWAHDQGPNNAIIYVEFFNSLVYKMNVSGFKPSSPPHVYKVIYSNGTYDLYVDGVSVATAESQQRPNVIVLGHPPIPWVPQTPQWMDEWGYWGWSSFEVDYISVKAEISSNESVIDDDFADNNELIPTQVSLSTNAEAKQVGYKVNLFGNLSSKEKAIGDERIILSVSISGLATWQSVTSVTTNVEGFYSATWIPTATGEFTLKAEFLGDTEFAGSYDTKNISIIEGADDKVFFVESNSTLSALAFNSTSHEASFNVSGSTGTEGYVRFVISKELVSDPTTLNVYLDANQLEYSVTDLTDSWQLYFTYKHSKHTVLVAMSQAIESASTYKESITTITISAALAVVGVGLLVYFKKRKR